MEEAAAAVAAAAAAAARWPNRRGLARGRPAIVRPLSWRRRRLYVIAEDIERKAILSDEARWCGGLRSRWEQRPAAALGMELGARHGAGRPARRSALGMACHRRRSRASIGLDRPPAPWGPANSARSAQRSALATRRSAGAARHSALGIWQVLTRRAAGSEDFGQATGLALREGYHQPCGRMVVVRDTRKHLLSAPSA